MADQQRMPELAEKATTKRHELREIEDKISEENGAKNDIGREITNLEQKKRNAERTLQSKDKLDVLVGSAQQGSRYRLRDEAYAAHRRLR